jgi:hypothetical protein
MDCHEAYLASWPYWNLINNADISLKDAASEEVKTEIRALLEQCRTALRDRAEEMTKAERTS